MTKITAQEARELAGPTVQERVDEAYQTIRAAAEKKQRKVHLHGWWGTAGYNGTEDYAEACKLLAADGFKVNFFYDARQFVDIYTVVEW